MLALAGVGGLVVSLLAAVLLLIRGVSGARSIEQRPNLKGPARLMLAGSAVSMAAIQVALLTDDFSLAYLARHHSSTTPFPFDVATAWAALEGSILLWGLVLAVVTYAVYRSHARHEDRLGSAALAVMGGVGLFFFALMLTVANPFEVCVRAAVNSCAEASVFPWAGAMPPAEGPGPNPLLQNHILMAIHPPLLYVGYVGLTVPFAYAIGALAIGEPGNTWLRRSHRSAAIAWAFLTLGITFGGWWAYEVLSWGGYWAWDPVENSSLMPWLVTTAFLHSAIVAQRRNMLSAWNLILVISAFALTILGTFLTRSGTINSVHSFTQSAIGPILLGFLVVVVVGGFSLFAIRADIVSSAPRVESLVSREGAFLANNLLLTVYGLVVLIGTTYPLILEAFTGIQVGVGEPFFNRLTVPLSFALLLAMGLGPVTPWGSTKGSVIWRRTRIPAVVAPAVGLVTALLVTRIGWVVASVTLGTFVVAAAVGVLLRQANRRRAERDETQLQAIANVARGDQPFWAGQASHFGVVLIAIGIAFSANLADHLEAELSPGQSVEFSGYAITYESPFQRETPNKVTRGARLSVVRDSEFVGTLQPAANFFGESSGVSTPDVINGVGGDLYVTLLDLDSASATLVFDTSPLVWLIWLGGLVTAAGAFWSVTARRRERTGSTRRQTSDV